MRAGAGATAPSAHRWDRIALAKRLRRACPGHAGQIKARLEWRQVDFAAGEVRLDAGTTKNGEGRVFPMTKALRALLEQQQAEKPAGRICPHVFHRKGEPIKSFRKAFIAACLAAGCPGRIPHDFRRAAVRNLVRAGVPERVAMQMTGHKTRSVFERYNIVSDGDLRHAVSRLDEADGHATGEIRRNSALPA